MQIIFQFVAKKNYDKFYPLQKMLKDIENEFIPEFEKILWVQITSQNCYQFIRLLHWLERSHLTFFDENIYMPSKDTKKVKWINEDYSEKNNLNSFVDMLDGYINLRYNTRIKPINLSLPPLWTATSFEPFKYSSEFYWLLFE